MTCLSSGFWFGQQWRERTRRISVKLFERTPEDLPTNLRFQVIIFLSLYFLT